MTVRYIGERVVDMIPGKHYKVLDVERGWYRIVDESGEDYLYGPSQFEVVSEAVPETHYEVA